MQIYVMAPDGSNQHPLTGAGSTFDSTPSWSPDGKRIAFARNGAIFVMAADGSGQRRLTHPARSELPAPTLRGPPTASRSSFERNSQSTPRRSTSWVRTAAGNGA